MEHLRIGSNSFDEVFEAVSSAVGAYLTHRKNTDPTRKGGYCTIVERLTEEVITTFEVGKPAHAKAEWYRGLSVEKALRLLETNAQHGHVTSGQSRNETNDKYAGAIIVEDYIFSFSGFAPDLADEATMIKAVHILGWISESEAEELGKVNKNEWVGLLLAA